MFKNSIKKLVHVTHLIHSWWNLRQVLTNAGDGEFGAITAAQFGAFSCFHR